MKKDLSITVFGFIFILAICIYAIVRAETPTATYYVESPVSVAGSITFNTTGTEYTISGRNNSTTAYVVVDCWDNTTNCKKLENEIATKATYFTEYRKITDTADADYLYANPPKPTE